MTALIGKTDHALIIEDNMVASHAIEAQLTAIGFHSFDHAWTQRQALELARMRRPDLVIVGDSLEAGSSMATAREISLRNDIPVLLATANSVLARQRLPDGASLLGPFRIDQLGIAANLATARSSANPAAPARNPTSVETVIDVSVADPIDAAST